MWIVDPASGELVVEGIEEMEALALAGDLLPSPEALNCALPIATTPLPPVGPIAAPQLRVSALWHGSTIEGPGRRSVLQVQGCPLRCAGCYVPHTHAADAGVLLSVDSLVSALLDPAGDPRDGVTVLGGEPYAQPDGLAALLELLNARGVQTLVYTGYTLESLSRSQDLATRRALQLTDILIDGPFVAALAADAPEWRGSSNQRVILQPSHAPHRTHSDSTGWAAPFPDDPQP